MWFNDLLNRLFQPRKASLAGIERHPLRYFLKEFEAIAQALPNVENGTISRQGRGKLNLDFDGDCLTFVTADGDTVASVSMRNGAELVWRVYVYAQDLSFSERALFVQCLSPVVNVSMVA